MIFLSFGVLNNLLLIVTVLYSYFVWKHRKTYFSPKGIPGPPSLPFIGNYYKLATLDSNGKLLNLSK